MFSPKIVILSAPSGSGKTTIIRYLLKEFSELVFSISATTRPIRPNEAQGKDYYFVDTPTFEKQIHENKFLEWELVYKATYYGTYKSEIERIHQLHKVPILDLDVVGGLNTKKIYATQCCAIFIEVPQVEVLKQRLLHRGMADDRHLQERLDKAVYEMTLKEHFDYSVVNIDIEAACRECKSIVHDFLYAI